MVYEVDWDAGHYYVQTGRFDEGDQARIRAIRGRRATAAQTIAIHAVMDVLAGADIEVEIDDGDRVWDGERHVLVAVS